MKKLQKQPQRKGGYVPVNTNTNPINPIMRFDYIGVLQNKEREDKLKAMYKQFQQEYSKEAIEQRANIEKEKFVRLSKLIYVLTMILPTYVSSMEESLSNLEDFGLKRDNLGDLGEAMQLFADASKLYEKGEQHLFKVWKYNQPRKKGRPSKASKDINNEADEFITNCYNNITDILENALRVTTDGKYKKDFNYVALIPQDHLNALDKWWGANFHGEKLEIF